MAYPIQMIEPVTHRTAVGFKGVSWTCLFFGPFPALFRGHFVGFLVVLLAVLCTFGFASIVFMFVYNNWHYNWLVSKSFKPAGAAMGMGMMANQNMINVHVAESK